MQLINTEVMQTVGLACQAALADQMPAYVYGASQIGKTTALKAFQAKMPPGRSVYLRMGSGWTRTRLVRELARLLHVGGRRGWEREDNIFAALTPHNLLLVDEFHLALETATTNAAKAMLEFIREVYDLTGCGLVMAATKVGMAGLESGPHRMLFDQLRRRGTVRVVLPDAPPVRDLNAFARQYGLPPPAGSVLAGIKHLVKTRGLGTYAKYLAKADAIAAARARAAKPDGKASAANDDTLPPHEPFSWDVYQKVAHGYLALGAMETEY